MRVSGRLLGRDLPRKKHGAEAHLLVVAEHPVPVCLVRQTVSYLLGSASSRRAQLVRLQPRTERVPSSAPLATGSSARLEGYALFRLGAVHPTSSERPPRRCATRSSPCRGASSTPADDGTYAYPRPALARPDLARIDADHREFLCAAEHSHPRPTTRSPAKPARPAAHPCPRPMSSRPTTTSRSRALTQQDQRWIRAQRR